MEKILKSKLKKAILYNPYPSKGGGGIVQKHLKSIINKSLVNYDTKIFSSADNLSGFKLYFSRLFRVYKNRKNLRNSNLFVIQSIFDPGSIFLGFIARNNKIPYYVIPRGDYIPTTKNLFLTKNFFIKRFIWFLFGKILVKNALAIIVTSELEKERFKKFLILKNHIKIIPDPTFEGIIKNASSDQVTNLEFLRLTRSPYALWLGRFAKEKGIDLLINAWPEVLKKNSKAKLLLIGNVYDEKEYKKILKKIKNLRLTDSIKIFEWVSGLDKNYLISNANCILLPSFNESFGIVVVESLSLRTPVIVSDGTPWKNISNKAGFCIPRDLNLWINTILYLINTKNKKIVPKSVVLDTLNQFSISSVNKLWRELFNIKIEKI